MSHAPTTFLRQRSRNDDTLPMTSVRQADRPNDDDEESHSRPLVGPATSAPIQQTVRSFVTSQASLFTVPILSLVTVAALDNADKQLLASSFPALERTLNLDVRALGYLSLSANLSYSLAMPLWGWLHHRCGPERAHDLLSAACLAWGLATLGIASPLGSRTVAGQAFFRSINGAALASILPLSQAMLVDLVDPAMRGRAFGLMMVCEKLAGTASAASAVYFEETWERPYVALGAFSVAMAFAMWRQQSNRMKKMRRSSSARAADKSRSIDGKSTGAAGGDMTLMQMTRRIAGIPAFSWLVAQGVFGAVPWDMMSFVLLLLDWRGFTRKQIVSLQFSMGLSGTVGGWLGGVLGDMFGAHHPRGRIYLAFTSVAGGIPLYGLFLFSTSYGWALLWLNLFNLWGSWTPAGANRPICAELARNPSERAQIVSMWILLEKTSAAVFGAPLVGYLTSGMISDEDAGAESPDHPEKVHALAFNLFYLSSFFWAVCASFWLLMARSTTKKTRSNEDDRDGRAELGLLLN